jgi:hypothetical protein
MSGEALEREREAAGRRVSRCPARNCGGGWDHLQSGTDYVHAQTAAVARAAGRPSERSLTVPAFDPGWCRGQRHRGRHPRRWGTGRGRPPACRRSRRPAATRFGGASPDASSFHCVAAAALGRGAAEARRSEAARSARRSPLRRGRSPAPGALRQEPCAAKTRRRAPLRTALPGPFGPKICSTFLLMRSVSIRPGAGSGRPGAARRRRVARPAPVWRPGRPLGGRGSVLRAGPRPAARRRFRSRRYVDADPSPAVPCGRPAVSASPGACTPPFPHVQRNCR